MDLCGPSFIYFCQKSREHDWERLRRQFAWLPKLVTMIPSNFTSNLITTTETFEERFDILTILDVDPQQEPSTINNIVDKTSNVATCFDIGTIISNFLFNHSIPWTNHPRLKLDQRHDVLLSHHITKIIASGNILFTTYRWHPKPYQCL